MFIYPWHYTEQLLNNTVQLWSQYRNVITEILQMQFCLIENWDPEFLGKVLQKKFTMIENLMRVSKTLTPYLIMSTMISHLSF